MAERLSDPSLARLSEFVATRMGLHFPGERWRDLERGIRSAAKDFGFSDAETCGEWLLSSCLSRREVETLASHLTVGETYFFREPQSFEALEHEVLPTLLASRCDGERRLRIWSAACCTGEEPYSIAILLRRLIPDLPDWHITILATDINPRFIQRASEGVYAEWSFRGTAPAIKELFFRQRKDGRFEILEEIKRMVNFSYLNLAEDAYPSLLTNTNAMDLILCRNVLMYFAPEPLQRAAENLYRCLVEGGWLIVSPTEASHALFSRFVPVHVPGSILYRKTAIRDQGRDARDREQEAKDSGSWGGADPRLPVADLQPPAPDPLSQMLGFPGESKKLTPRRNPHEEASELYERGCYPESAETLLASFADQQPATETALLLARSYANQGRLDEALSWCEKAVEADNLNPRSHYLLATIFQECGKMDHAAVALRRALYLEPEFIPAYFVLGTIARQQGKPEESKKHFNNALLLLRHYRPDEILPDLEGITAGRLGEIIEGLHAATEADRK